jgi:hypothetical protein
MRSDDTKCAPVLLALRCWLPFEHCKYASVAVPVCDHWPWPWRWFLLQVLQAIWALQAQGSAGHYGLGCQVPRAQQSQYTSYWVCTSFW